MSTFACDPFWDGPDDELDEQPRITRTEAPMWPSPDDEFCDAIRANEAACERRTWYEDQSDHDIQQFRINRGIEVTLSGDKTLREDTIDAIMTQYMDLAVRDVARGRGEDSKRRAWYSEQSDSDLWQFIKQRNTNLPLDSSQASREDMIEALMAQDKNMQFPFMKLPSELRNHIYWYLLVDQAQHATDIVEKPRISCYPNILAACSYIRKEAWNVLYANAYVTLDLEFYYDGDHFKIDCSDSSARSTSPTQRERTRAPRAHVPPHWQQQLAHNGQLHVLPNNLAQLFNNHFQQTGTILMQQALVGPPPIDQPVQASSDTAILRAASRLHNEVISKVGHVNINIVIANRAVLESGERTTEVRQIVTELKDFMAKHAGREQTVCVTFDLDWKYNGGESSEAYKKNPANKQHILHDAFKILEPFSQIEETKDYGHLAGCQQTEVIFMVSEDISKEVVEKLEGRKQEVAKKSEEKKLGPTTLGCLVLTKAQVLQNEIDSRVTESIFKKYWREDLFSHEPNSEDRKDHTYTLSPKKQAREVDLWDTELGKDDDSVHFDSDDDEEMQDDDDEELFDPEDLEDDDYDLDDLIVDATPAAEPIAFHPELEENREIKEWLKNGGFRSELNNLREARVLALDTKKGSEQQSHSVFGNN
ncbi:hypothetical protein E2P81_ATG09070 [Venturia nashicola]|uniref:Uncharacterized protein n=1 Tax=Venturia nashicola TaxID=86259 RepID=A0A4Z1NFN1_9PEZI|nr:hypothetical protein E6O75_ATG09270 [Venturia nashicola]TLD20000.1 hypothetical protein E2P81_ATG09070 [Venturia nashicola]